MYKKALIYEILFFLPTLGFMLMTVFSRPHFAISGNNYPTFLEIISRNIGVLLFLYLFAYIHKYLGYILYFSNAILFSISFALFGNVPEALIRILPYGLFEVFAFSLSLSLGVYKKNIFKIKYFKILILSIILLTLAAVIETILIKEKL